LRDGGRIAPIMTFTQVFQALDQRGISEALFRSGEPMQLRVNGEWRSQGAPAPLGTLAQMIEGALPPDQRAAWDTQGRCQFPLDGYAVKAARDGERVQIAVKRQSAQTSQSPFAAGATSADSRASAPAQAPTQTTVIAPKPLVPMAAAQWYYLDGDEQKGPFVADRFKTLISMGTLGADTVVWRDGLSDWMALGNTELAPALPKTAAIAAPAGMPIGASAAPIANPNLAGVGQASAARTFAPTVTGEEQALEATRNRGANWFFWIVGLTVINTIVSFTGIDWSFSLGASVSIIADYIARESGSSSGRMIALGFDVVVISFYAFCGVMAMRGATWAFIIGLVCFALDSLLLLLSFQIIGILIHGWALFVIFSGAMACANLNRIRRERAILGGPIR